MIEFQWKHALLIAAAALLVIGLLLWSWNTLASLAGAPEASFRHALAAMVALLLARGFLHRRRGTRR